MYATVYVYIHRNTSKILPTCYCLKTVVKLTLKIWNDFARQIAQNFILIQNQNFILYTASADQPTKTQKE